MSTYTLKLLVRGATQPDLVPAGTSLLSATHLYRNAVEYYGIDNILAASIWQGNTFVYTII